MKETLSIEAIASLRAHTAIHSDFWSLAVVEIIDRLAAAEERLAMAVIYNVEKDPVVNIMFTSVGNEKPAWTVIRGDDYHRTYYLQADGQWTVMFPDDEQLFPTADAAFAAWEASKAKLEAETSA